MPVEDHPVHESTKKPADYKYGCWNRGKFEDGYWAHPWAATGAVWVPFRMSKECKFDMSATDRACFGCERRKS